MTTEDGLNKLQEYVQDQINESGFLIFNKRRLKFDRTRLFKQYERTANLKLPDKLENRTLIINFDGIKIGNKFFNWNSIIATGIKSEFTPDNSSDVNPDIIETHLLICLLGGKIIEITIDNVNQYHGQFGHFIEQYKQGDVKL